MADVLGRLFAAFFALTVFLLGYFFGPIYSHVPSLIALFRLYSSLFCAVASNMPMLVLARAIQGVGGGGELHRTVQLI